VWQLGHDAKPKMDFTQCVVACIQCSVRSFLVVALAGLYCV
jgi:hypothetical protein